MQKIFVPLHRTGYSVQSYKQMSEKYQACLDIFYSECSVCSLFTAKLQTNEREISSLLEYFLQRVQCMFAVCSKVTKKNAVFDYLRKK